MPVPINFIMSLAGRPMMIEPEKAQTIMDVLMREAIKGGIDWENPQTLHSEIEHFGYAYRVESGAAIIPINGSLAHQSLSLRPESGMTGYDGLRMSVLKAIEDPTVESLIFEIDSPGGHVSGLYELSSLIANCPKPTAAYIDATCFSAAYFIASQCDIVAATPSSMAGSIGAVFLHIDRSAQLAASGLAYNFIHSGSEKVAGNSAEPLSDSARSDIQEFVDRSRDKFATAVGEGRGARFTREDALATEARVYSADQALEMGMIDVLLSPEDAVSELAAAMTISPDSPISAFGGVTQPEESGAMADKSEAPKPGAESENKLSPAQKAERMLADARAEATSIREAAAAEAEAVRQEAKASAARSTALTALSAPEAVKELLAGDDFKSVPVEALEKLSSAIPPSLADQADEAGGAGVKPDPTNALSSSHAEDKAARLAAAVEAAEKMGGIGV